MSITIQTKTKKIYDSVHGFIRFNDLESKLIDSEPFQRLHCLHQLGIAYKVYPGATHTRFEHSLGVMELASRIFDHVFLDSELQDKQYARQMIRLAALSHDLGHLPFSHVAEHALLGKEGHEGWTMKIIQSSHFDPVIEELKKLYPDKDVVSDLIKYALGEKKVQELGVDLPFTPWERVVSRLVSGDFFGADRMDYLLRDAKYTGVAYGLFDYHQLIEMLRILPVNDELELGIEENGIESCEALLLARMFMHKRVYQYSTVKAYSFHLARFMKTVYSDKLVASLDSYLSHTDHEVITEIHKAAKDPSHPGHQDALCITLRVKRCKAIPTKGISTQTGLSFPVLTHSGEIAGASTLSEIHIPTGPLTWTYLEQ